MFGINCGHKSPNVFVHGLSVVREGAKESKEVNDRRYEESQKQRRLEREVRKSKREAVMLKNAGDVEGFKQARAKAKEQNKKLMDYCGEVGRTYRPDRTQVVGYDGKPPKDLAKNILQGNGGSGTLKKTTEVAGKAPQPKETQREKDLQAIANQKWTRGSGWK